MGKVIVTGGAGFIGSHVVDLLIERGKDVIVIDNMSSGKIENIEQHKSIHLYEYDINDDRLKDVFADHIDVEGLIHLAAQSKVTPSVEDPNYDAKININGTIHLLELCRKHGVQNVVYASSAAVYGHTETLPIVEETTVQPLSPYGVSKYAGEEYVKAFGRLYEMNVHALRFANVYGPRQSAETEAGVITIFIEQLMSGAQPVIFGDGEQTRDFVYVEDVAKAVMSCLLDASSERIDRVYNVSTGYETSINNLLQEMCKVLQIDFSPQYKEERPGDIKESYLANDRLRTDYKWEPNVALPEGILKTINYYRENK
ncbi:SDR family NAD(P)-dependent oxidoreductase [Evansella halocellulosilytica]|uniref:SDR family NAD(P)-dependent oxidoreductase n=1 Tax=Evansella halocellulosilytica TaxID=2011013 RepID=UPI000BB7A46D|nr:SDR family NAD(P)-dependent oxidoreductase [Evansella halocellulosilytica]